MYLHYLLLLTQAAAIYNDIRGLPSDKYELIGDINIGGVFPLHQAGHDKAFCGPLRELGVLQRAEAMAFYIREFNKNDDLLPNITLGFIILDDCYKETAALAQGLQFIPQGDGNGTKRKEDIVAVIGAESSTNSKQLAELLGLFQIPQISYLSTSPLLGDPILFPFFTRIVPSDMFQIKAMLDLMAHYKWSYVSFVFSGSFYGIHAYLLLIEMLRNGTNLCLAVAHDLPENPTLSDYDAAVESLLAGSNGKPAHAVILFLSQSAATGVLKAAQERELYGQFTWIASDAWGRNLQDFDDVKRIAEGTLSVNLASQNDPKFDQHFKRLSPRTTENPFLQEFWNDTCKDQKRQCNISTPFEQLSDDYRPEMTVGLVKSAIYSLVGSLDELYRRCKYSDTRDSTDEPCTAKEFRQYITGDSLQEMLFNNMQSNIAGAQVNVNKGEGKIPYSIMNFKNSGREYKLVQIGTYITEQQTLYIFPNVTPSWHSKINESNFKDDIPMSVCSRVCRMGQKQTRLDFYNSRCCWECEDCKPNEYTKVTAVNGQKMYECEPCEYLNNSRLRVYTSPTDTNDSCQPIVPQSIGFTDPSSIAILAIDIICVIATVVLLVIYVRNRKQRLIKATSLELSYIIWAGVLLSYVCILGFFMPLQTGCISPEQCDIVPSMHWCYFQYMSFSLSFTVIIAPVLTRANRIHRIFSKGKKSVIKPRFIESRYQLMFAGILIVIQVVITTICCMVSHFTTENTMSVIKITNYQPGDDVTKSYISCQIPISLILPPLIYNLLLGIACAYHAFKTRRLPDNFKESRFIGMAVYTTVIVWVAFIPAYLSINSKYYKGVPLCVAMLINSLITTSCLFVPRLYALRWVDGGRMNLRSLSISLQSFSDKSRRASTPDGTLNQQPSIADSSTRNIMATPDIISTACYQNEAVDCDVQEARASPEHNSVTFEEKSYMNSVVIGQMDSSEYPV